MFARLILLLAAVGILELYVLIELGRWLGPGPVLAWILATALFGTYFAKSEGLRVWRAWQVAVASGRIPEEGIVSGLLVLIGGLLLVLPGVLSDVAGLVLLLPPTRRRVASTIRRRVEKKLRSGAIHVVSWRSGSKEPPRLRGREED